MLVYCDMLESIRRVLELLMLKILWNENGDKGV
jgi:hypothetical protein